MRTQKEAAAPDQRTTAEQDTLSAFDAHRYSSNPTRQHSAQPARAAAPGTGEDRPRGNNAGGGGEQRITPAPPPLESPPVLGRADRLSHWALHAAREFDPDNAVRTLNRIAHWWIEEGASVGDCDYLVGMFTAKTRLSPEEVLAVIERARAAQARGWTQ